MDYKKIIKNQTTRLKILRLLSFVPDRWMLIIQYFIKFRRRLNLKDPRRFTEKMQWYKLYYKNPLMIKCVDKNDVREYVKSKGLEKNLIPCYGVYNSPEEIDWDSLPNQFVMKDTLGSGGHSVQIIRDKEHENLNMLKEVANKWVSLAANKKDGGREWPYYSGKEHRIIIEKLLINPVKEDEGIQDYKIYCFNGEPRIINVDFDRYSNHKRIYYDTGWNQLDIESNYPKSEQVIEKPFNLEEMLAVARTLSVDTFPFVRVDLYNIEGNIYFGELTFFPSSGYMWYKPDDIDFMLGDMFILPSLSQQVKE